MTGILVSAQDREMLYHKFLEYRIFADAYNCPLDGEGTIGGNRTVEIAPNRFLKFHGINTALICSRSKNEEGTLLLGERQRVIPIVAGVEVIVIGHHPMHWLQDSEDALRYIKNRARLFISGHEHTPAHKLESIDEHSDLLSLAAGATVPPVLNANFTYCYNVLEFNLNEKKSALEVTVHPRIWKDEKKAFASDTKHFQKDKCTFILKCPNYRKIKDTLSSDRIDFKEASKQNLVASIQNIRDVQVENTMSDNLDQILLFKFFRELSSSQRLSILVKLGVIPAEVSDGVTHSIETAALKSLFSAKRHIELQDSINQILSQKIQDKND